MQTFKTTFKSFSTLTAVCDNKTRELFIEMSQQVLFTFAFHVACNVA